MTDKVEISEDSLTILVNEAEMTLEAIEDPEWHYRGRISNAVEEAREAMRQG